MVARWVVRKGDTVGEKTTEWGKGGGVKIREGCEKKRVGISDKKVNNVIMREIGLETGWGMIQ